VAEEGQSPNLGCRCFSVTYCPTKRLFAWSAESTMRSLVDRSRDQRTRRKGHRHCL